MPILLGVTGLVLIIAGVRDRIIVGNPSLMSLLQQDFSGPDPFWKWFAAIFLIGAIGYIPNLAPLSRAFLVLVIAVFLLSNGGVFSKLENIFANNQNELDTLQQHLQQPQSDEVNFNS